MGKTFSKNINILKYIKKNMYKCDAQAIIVCLFLLWMHQTFLNQYTFDREKILIYRYKK